VIGSQPVRQGGFAAHVRRQLGDAGIHIRLAEGDAGFGSALRQQGGIHQVFQHQVRLLLRGERLAALIECALQAQQLILVIGEQDPLAVEDGSRRERRGGGRREGGRGGCAGRRAGGGGASCQHQRSQEDEESGFVHCHGDDYT